MAIIGVGVNITDEMLIRLSCSSDNGEKWEWNEKGRLLYIDFKKAYNLVRGGGEVLYNILTEFGVTMTLVWLITMCLNEENNKVNIGKYWLITFISEMV
jgi:hypothetical protein